MLYLYIKMTDMSSGSEESCACNDLLGDILRSRYYGYITQKFLFCNNQSHCILTTLYSLPSLLRLVITPYFFRNETLTCQYSPRGIILAVIGYLFPLLIVRLICIFAASYHQSTAQVLTNMQMMVKISSPTWCAVIYANTSLCELFNLLLPDTERDIYNFNVLYSRDI